MSWKSARYNERKENTKSVATWSHTSFVHEIKIVATETPSLVLETKADRETPEFRLESHVVLTGRTETSNDLSATTQRRYFSN